MLLSEVIKIDVKVGELVSEDFFKGLRYAIR